MTSTQLEKKASDLLLICFHILILITPFLFTWFNEELFEFNKILFVYAMTGIVGATWLVKTVAARKIELKHSVFSLLVIGFLGTQLLSTLFSIHIPTSLFGYYTRFNGGLLSLFCYSFLFFVALQEFSFKQIKTILISLAISGLGVALFAIPEHFGYAFSCIFIRQTFSTSCWIQDVQNRIFGSFGQPNWLAAFALTLIPVLIAQAYSYYQKEKSKQHFWLFLITPLLLILTLIFTKSRSGWLGLGAELFLFAGGVFIIWFKQKPRPPLTQFAPFRIIGGIVVSLGVAAAMFGTPWTKGLESLLTPPPVESAPVDRLEQGGTDSGEIRKIVWEGAIKVWQRYPLLGSGVETFAYSYYQDRPLTHNTVSEWDFLYNKAHNEFLNYLATTGILGTGAYVLLHIWWVWFIYKVIINPRVKKDLDKQVTALGFFAAIVGLSISNALGFSTVVVSFLFFLYPALAMLYTQDFSTSFIQFSWSKKTSEKLQFSDYFLIALICSLAAYIVMQVAITWFADYTYKQGKDEIRAGQTQRGIASIESAFNMRPSQPLFTETLSTLYSQVAVSYAQAGATESAELALDRAIAMSNATLLANPVHLNFYKTRTRVFSMLGQLNPQFIEQAVKSAEVAVELAPTDPQSWYQLGMLQVAQGETETGITTLEKSIALRPQNEQARQSLAAILVEEGKLEPARDQYRYILDNLSPQNPVALQGLAIIEASLSATPK